VICIHF